MNSPPTDPDVDAQACEWLVRLTNKDPDPTDPDADREALQMEFFAWVTLSRHHLEAFLETIETFEKLAGIDRHHRIDVRELLNEVPNNVVPLRAGPSLIGRIAIPSGTKREAQVVQDREQEGDTVPTKRWSWAAVLAAAFILPLIGPVMPPRISAAPTSYSTSLGERQITTLPDGTTVYMNTNSRIEVGDFSGSAREVRLLAWEALFTVTHNPLHPFRVRIPGALVQDMGTKFSVYLHEGATTVSVVEGAVQVSSSPPPAALDRSVTDARPSTKLVAGEVLDLSPSGETHIRHAPLLDLERKLSWTDGRLSFSGETLAEAAAEFNRYNTQQIVVDSDIRGLHVGGTFSPTDPDAFLTAIIASAPVRVLQPDTSDRESSVIRLGSVSR